MPLVEINGSQVVLPIAGIEVAANDSQISALSITGFRGSGIKIDSADRVIIEDNYLGIDTSGIEAGNGSGVRLQDADFNTLMDNVISGNDFAGVELRMSADDNTITNNKIGTTIAGDAAVANYVGVHSVAQRNKILDNLIGGNSWAGLALVGPTTGSDSIVQGNLIGSNEQSVAIPNENLGVFITSSSNQIGGTELGDGNVISGNGNIGVLVRGNTDNRLIGNHVGIGTNGLALGNTTTGVRIVGSRNITVQRNVISANGTVGLFVGGVNSPNATLTENYIGTSVNGRQGQGNGTLGMILNGAPDALIADNVIAGNERGGVYAVSGDTRFQFVGNHVGTDVTATVGLINKNYGLYVRSNDNQIGTSEQPNVIASDGIGAFIHGSNNRFDNNAFGTDLTGELDFGMRMGVFLVKGASGNQISSNSFGNLDTAIRNRDGGVGNSYLENRTWNIGRFVIDNGVGGIQANDVGDGDVGPNDMINRPEISGVQVLGNLLNVEFSVSLNTSSLDEYRLEFVVTDQLGRSSLVWGVRTLSAAQLSSVATVQLPADVVFNAGLNLFVAAHLTDAAGSTSELSDPFAVELS
jgi:parallel beta-helix repeat protein